MKNIITNFQSIFNISGIFNLINNIYINCITNNHGGAIFSSNVNIIFFITFCSFLKCHADQRGGAICVYGIDKILIKKICILNCTASFTSPGLNLWGIYGNINQIDFNNSDYNNPFSSAHSSYLCSFKLIMNHINISNTIATTHTAGIFFGNNESTNISSFCQIINSKGPAFLGLSLLSTNLQLILNNYNFINNSVTLSWFQISRYYCIPIIVTSFFQKIPNFLIVSHIYNGDGQFQFFNYLFNFNYDSNSHSSISNLNNIFNINLINFNIINNINTFYCWNNFTFSKSYQNFYKNFNFLIFFNNLFF